MKRILSLILIMGLLAAMLTACGGKTDTPPATDATAAPAPAPTQAVTAPAQTAAPTPTPPPYNTYDYADGGVIIAVPLSLPAEPKAEDGAIVFSDPEGAWTVRFTPLTPQSTENELNNAASRADSIRNFNFYRDVALEDTSLGGFSARQFTFTRNPDWDTGTQGDSLYYREGHRFIVVNYGDIVIGEWGGLMIDIAAPKDSLSPIDEILRDPDVQTLTENLAFHEGSTSQTAAVPGLSVEFPARWNIGSNGTTTVWAMIRGAFSGSVYFGYSAYADPDEAAGYAGANSGDVRSLTYDGTVYSAALRRSELNETTIENLELYAPFTDNHALQVTLNLKEADAETLWAYTETDAFRAIMASVKLDASAYAEPEADRKNADGFECNSVGEINAYNGTETDLTLPSVIGSNEIVGVNTGAFRGNETLRSVVIPEGVLYIGANAFRDCSALERVVLPNSLVYIDYNAFADCSKLRDVTFGETLSIIEAYAFENCASLGDVILPEAMTQIGNGAFSGAGDGTGSFSCPADGVFYGSNSLAGSAFDSVTIGPNADLSSYGILADAILSELRIGAGCAELGELFLTAPRGHEEDPLTVELNGVKKIGANAFLYRKGLSAIDLTGCEALGEDCFESTGLTEITIPGTIREIPEWAFASCPYLLTVTVEEGVEAIRANAFNYSGRIGRGREFMTLLSKEDAEAYGDLIKPNGSPEYDRALNVTLPSTLTTVEEYAFNAVYIEGVWLLWCTDPAELPDFDVNAFAGGIVMQVYFTEETIGACGDQLDAYFSALNDVDEPAWYYEGCDLYWSEDPLQ